MKLNVSRRSTCRLCSSPKLELALPLKPTALADAYLTNPNIEQGVYPLDLYLCQDCGFLQLLEIISPEDIYVDYIYETVSSLGLVKHFQGYAQEIIQQIQPPTGALVVDLGSNDGTLLQAFKDQGMRVLGVDPAREIARQATEKGIETLPIFFNKVTGAKLRADYGAAQIITCNNLYANVDELDDFTQGLVEFLADDGVFIFESFYLVDYLQNMVFDFAYHEHLSYFSLKPLVAFFKKHQMEVINVQRVPTKGGSMRYTVQKIGGPRPVQPAVEQILALEAEVGTYRLSTYQDFAHRIDEAKTALRNVLARLKGEGKDIVGYGASATTTTLMYHFELDEYIDYMVDEYTAKQGTFSPGHHIPVYGPAKLLEDKPAAVVIMAWRYADPIMQKNAAYLEQGGQFIVPLPSLKIYGG